MRGDTGRAKICIFGIKKVHKIFHFDKIGQMKGDREKSRGPVEKSMGPWKKVSSLTKMRRPHKMKGDHTQNQGSYYFKRSGAHKFILLTLGFRPTLGNSQNNPYEDIFIIYCLIFNLINLISLFFCKFCNFCLLISFFITD